MNFSFNKITFKNWHLIYYCLAAFDLITIGLSLTVNHTIVENFVEAVETNELWLHRNTDYLKLGQLSAAANAPGNNVFQSLDVNQERSALLQAEQAFVQQIDLIKQDLNQHAGAQNHETFLSIIDRLVVHMREMIKHANLIFNEMDSQQKEKAGQHMAAMDNAYYKLQSVLNELNTAVGIAQQAFLNQQREKLNDTKKWEYVVASLVAVIILSITLYGQLLNKQIRRVEQEKQDAFKKIVDAQIRNKSVLDAAADAIITIDEQGNVESFNRAATTMFGFRAEEIIGKSAKLLMPEKDAHLHDNFIKESDGSEAQKVIGIGRELNARRKDGSEFPIELAISRAVLMEKVHFTEIIRDISERKKNEKLKSEFIASVSHELRTPLTSIRGSLSLLENGVLGELPATVKNMITLALRNSERLSKLVNDLLDIQKLDADAMTFQFGSFEVNQFIRNSVDSLLPYAQQFNIALEIESSEPVYLWGDESRLTQVLVNLLSNAIKFSRTGGRVTVSGERLSDYFKVCVIDSGPGISPEFEQRIFDRFSQADATTAKAHYGTGLGLNISKHIVEKNNGEISFINLQDGAMFFFTIPLDMHRNSTLSASA